MGIIGLFGLLLGYVVHLEHNPRVSSTPVVRATSMVNGIVGLLTPHPTEFDYLVPAYPTQQPIASPTSTITPTDMVVPTMTPTQTLVPKISCAGLSLEQYQLGQVVRIIFEDVGALRLLAEPRTDGSTHDRNVLRLLYDNEQLRITGSPVCGSWSGLPVVYYPVDALRWNKSGWVGVASTDDIWVKE